MFHVCFIVADNVPLAFSKPLNLCLAFLLLLVTLSYVNILLFNTGDYVGDPYCARYICISCL